MRSRTNSATRAIRVLPLALILGLFIACTEFSEFEAAYDGLVPPPTAVSAEPEQSRRSTNFLSEDFSQGWLVRASSADGGSRQIVATDPGDRAIVVTSLVRTLGSEKAAKAQFSRTVDEIGSAAQLRQVDIGDGAVLIQRESSFEIIFTQGTVFGRLSTRGDEDDAIDWANRLVRRIDGNPLPPPAAASLAARARVFRSSVRPTAMPEPAGPSEPSPEPTEQAVATGAEPVVEATAVATSTEFVMLDLTLELSSTASVPSVGNPPFEQVSEGMADLLVSNIVPGSNPAIPGSNVKWTVTISDGGAAAARESSLAVFVRQTSTTTTMKVGELELPDVPAGAAVGIVFNRPAIANEIIEFAVLPGSTPDLREGNNYGSVVVSGIMLPDLIIESLSPTDEAVYPNQWAEWQLTVTNVGAGNFYGETVVELLGDVDGAATTTFVVGALASGGRQQFTFGSLVAEETSLSARVDYAGHVLEFNEFNNTLSDVLWTAALRPNLVIESVTSIPEFPEPGDSVVWTYSVLNLGPGDSKEFDLAILASMDLTTTSTTVFQAASNGLATGEIFQGSFKRTAVAEESLRFVVGNPGALEISDVDNVLEFAIHERMLADLQIASVTPNRLDIDSGEAFTYRIEIENVGQGDVSRITEISMIDVASREEIANVRGCPIARGESLTVKLDLNSADGQSLSFVVDPTSKIRELDEENNSFEVSVLDVMTHDTNIESLTVAAPIDFIETTSFRWVIANNGPGRALNLNAHATIFHASGGSTVLAVVVISSLEAGAMTTGITKYLPIAGDRFVIVIETPDQVEMNDLDNTAEVLVDDLQA